MGLGFTSKEEEVEEEYVPLYRTVIECPLCGDKELYKLYKGTCTCKNIEIDVVESISKVRHIVKSTWTHFKTVKYNSEEPLIYEVLIADKVP